MRPSHALLELTQIVDDRGSLLVAQANANVPFTIKRLFVLHDLAAGTSRGFHAHREQHQLLFMLAGSCTVIVDDGVERKFVRLDKPSMALHAPPMLWLELEDFAPGSVCAVLTSGEYDPHDYIRDRAEFDALTSSDTHG